MSDLPTGWETAELAQVISSDGIFSDGDWVESKDQDPNGTIRLLQLADIGDGIFVDKSNRFINEEQFERLRCTEVLERDVLIARMPDPLGRACIAPALKQKCVTVVDVAIVRPGQSSVFPKWLMHFLNAPPIRQGIELQATGTTRRRISRGNLTKLQLPIPPLNEQKCIADKLDAVLARVDACRERLDRVPAILKRFRQSVLAAATSGKLTEEWRNASEPPLAIDGGNAGLFELPAGWVWVPVSTISEVKGGKRLPKGSKLVSEDTGFPYIKAGQLKKGTVQKEGQEYLPREVQKFIKRYIVNAGDVYMTIVGACIGDAGIIPHEYDQANLTENAAKLCDLKGVRNDFLAYWLRSPVAQDHIEFLVKSGAQGKLALMRIKEITVPLPSMDEQKEIVRRVEDLFAYADRLEARYATARAQVEKLTPALLAKAFRGELVPQDPNDEPASVLLERIRENRAIGVSKSKPRTRKQQLKTQMASGRIVQPEVGYVKKMEAN